MKTMIVAACAAATSAGAQVNILDNPGFETGALDPWFQAADLGGAEDWNATDADAHTGAFSATNLGNKLLIQEFDPVPVADILEASFWIKQPEVAISAVYFRYSDDTIIEDVIFLTTPDWEFYDQTASLAPGKELVAFGLYGYTGGGPDEDRTYVDDWTLAVKGDDCGADCNADGVLNILDFVCFQGLFQAGDPAADCNADGVLNILDFVCFQQLFQKGCP